MKRVGFTLWEIISAVALVAIGGAIVYPLFVKRYNSGCRPPACQNRLKQISIAVIQYSQDADENYPLVQVTPMSNAKLAYGWADALQPYIKNANLFQCREEVRVGQNNPLLRDYSDFWFNRRLSGLNSENISAPSKSLMIGDGNDGSDLTDARYNLHSLPPSWLSNTKSPAHRHKGMANYSFLDGHVKALPAHQITNEPLANGKPTFAVR
jgi:prepilin-type processing-associated H-X9-DG protein